MSTYRQTYFKGRFFHLHVELTKHKKYEKREPMGTSDENNINKMFYTLYSIAAIIIIIFIFSGTDEIITIREIIDKMTTINFTLAIGYGAIVPALAAISTSKNSFNHTFKKEILNFIKMIVAYVLINIIIVSFTFDTVDYPPLLMRTIIGLMIALVILLSQVLIKLTNKLLN